MAYATIPSRYGLFCDRQKRTNPVSTTRTGTANEAHDAKRRAKWLGRTSETLRGCPRGGGYASRSSSTSPRWGSSPVVVRGSRSVLLQHKNSSEAARSKPTLRTFHHRVIKRRRPHRELVVALGRLSRRLVLGRGRLRRQTCGRILRCRVRAGLLRLLGKHAGRCGVCVVLRVVGLLRLFFLRLVLVRRCE